MPTIPQTTRYPHLTRPLPRAWMLILFTLVLLLSIVIQASSAYSSNSSALENSGNAPGLPRAVAATPTATMLATPTRTSQPTATQTATPSLTKEIVVKVAGFFVNFRTGPDNNYSIIQQLNYDDPLILLGRLNDNTWLFVKTSGGQVGWVTTTWVNLTGVNIDQQAIITPPQPETTVKVSGSSVNLRSGPGSVYTSIETLSYGDLLAVTGRLSDNTWLYVKTSAGQEGWIKTTLVELKGNYRNYDFYPVQPIPPTPTSTPVILGGVEGHWIDVDLSEQMLYAYDGTELVASFLVSTGVRDYPTERGLYRIQTKLLFSDMTGTDYFLPDVPYAMYYAKGFSIHGTYWHHNFGTPMSHGCINMDTDEAEWLYNWSPLGTLINIHR